MLTALLSEKKIIATDPRWADRKEEYRTLCNNQAICPICQERIICKFGEIKQHHFAHRRNTDCPGNHDTEEHMLGKAILYEFLETRYGQEARIDLEHYIPELNMNCDLLVEFHDGRRWAVEFYCGSKEQALRDKIQYYKKQKIDTTWLLSKPLFREHSSKQEVKILPRERLLLTETGIDKFYRGDWHTKVVVCGLRMKLPRDQDCMGSLLYLDSEQKVISIMRDVKFGEHHNIFEYSSLLEESLDEIIIKNNLKYGIIWYLEQEQEWGKKYLEAKRVLNKLQDLNTRKTSNDNSNNFRPLSKKPILSTVNLEFSIRSDESFYGSAWEEKDTPIIALRYRCFDCGKEYDLGDMISIPQFNVPEGTCRECSRKKER